MLNKENRSEMAPFVGQRIRVRAFFDRFGKRLLPATGTQVPTALLQEVYLEETRLADHVWLQQALGLTRFDPQHGERVEFWARVGRYDKGFHLEFPDAFVFPDRDNFPQAA